MHHTIRVILLIGILSASCVAQEQPTAASANAQTDAETATPNSKAIVLVIDANSQQSVVVNQVVEALENAGIATSKAAETAPATNSPISVTLNMRKDESYEKLKQLIEALKNAGVQQIALCEGGVQYQGKEINQLYVDLQPGYSPAEYQKIDLATLAVMDQCGMSLLRARSGLPGEFDERRTLNRANLPVSDSDSSERTDTAMDSGFIRKASQSDLRTQYEAANKQAHDLAESLRQTPDAAKKSELRTAVQRAFTLRQSLLRAELQEMQARLEKTQRSLDMRERISDQIIDRRVEDLLNPQLDWEGETGRVHETKISEIPKHQQLGLRFAWDDVKGTGDNFDRGADIFESSSNHVAGVIPGSAAEAAGFLVGDHLFAVNGLQTWGRDSFVSTLRNQSPGPVECMLIRNGRQVTLELEFPPETSAAFDAPQHDPQKTFLDKLQGLWDFQELSVEHPELRSFPNGPQMIYEIRGNRMASLPNEPELPTWNIRFGEPATPQPIDLYYGEDAPIVLGIIEITDDIIRICMNNTSGESIKRPTEFAVTKDADILVLRRRTAQVTELEGEWHLVAYIDKWQTERRPRNLTIRGNQGRETHWTGKSTARSFVLDAGKQTIDFGSRKVEDGNEIFSERRTYRLVGETLTIQSEYKRIDSVRGTLIQKGQHTDIWKRGLCDIGNYDSRNPGFGMAFFYLNGNDENTGAGKLIPGEKVDVLVLQTKSDLEPTAE
jgi:biopolymer transport protein ExbD